jgi:hypothetical protein
VYTPADVIEPPPVSAILHSTVVFEAPVTPAEKFCVPPAVMLAVPGVTTTLTGGAAGSLSQLAIRRSVDAATTSGRTMRLANMNAAGVGVALTCGGQGLRQYFVLGFFAQ